MIPSSRPSTNLGLKKDDEELATLGGKTRFVRHGSTSASPSSNPVSPPSHSVSPPLTAAHQQAQTPSIASQDAVYPRPDQFSPIPSVAASQQSPGWPPYRPALESAHAYDYNTHIPSQQWMQQLPPAEEFSFSAAHDGAMSIEMLADQYGVTSFDYSASMPVNSYYGQSGSESDSMMQTAEVAAMQDPTAAWQSLVAQFGHV